MKDRTPNQLLDHNYDGIEEYDNPLPRWWVWIFWATIIFAELYFIWFHLGPGRSIHDEYAEEMATWDARLAELAPAAVSEADLQKILGDPARVQAGALVFAGKCMPCHAADGGGMTGLGPNLTDDWWKQGDGSLAAIYQVVRDGVAGTAMQAWDQQLKPGELQEVTAFVHSLQGTTPANPKEPEGRQLGVADQAAGQ
ncbi:MAG: cbb3-type cytochrome c oxidase N-terminal domain-containing protein [bacterium]|jgi:cytochrome c oxidase cbb3-type subunit 3|nr:cbb3-type cytochrome c oxidase N-terminal domain-containing protein [bacterium]